MDSANIQRGLNPPLNEVSFKNRIYREVILYYEKNHICFESC
ncbi:MAG: hypothetical protein AB1815_07495 [Bacillota bacterium]